MLNYNQRDEVISFVCWRLRAIEVPWFCVVVVSNICVDEVEELVSPPGHVELLLHRDENTMLNYNQRDGSYELC